MIHVVLVYAGLLAGLAGDAPPSSQDLQTYEALEQGGGWPAGTGQSGALVRGPRVEHRAARAPVAGDPGRSEERDSAAG